VIEAPRRSLSRSIGLPCFSSSPSFFSLNLDPPPFLNPDPAKRKKTPFKIQQTVARITDVCWDTCLPGTPGRSLSSKEQACVSECAKRFIEATQFVIARFQSREREDAAGGGFD